MSAVVPFPSLPPSVRHPRAGFEAIPRDISRSELLRYFTFSDNDLQQIRACRGEINRIGFALLLSGVRLTGRFPYDFELVSNSVLKHVCDQLGLEVPLFISYPPGGRRPTRHEHIERLRSYLGLRTFIEEDKELVKDHVHYQVRGGCRPHELLTSTERMLRDQHIALPGVTVLEKLIRSARTDSEEKLYQELCERIGPRTKEKILSLFQVPAGQQVSTFQRLRRATRGPTPKALDRELDSLEVVREVLPATLDLSDVHAHLLERLATAISALPTYAIQQFPEQKRLALLLCWFWRLRTQITDTALTINNDLIAGTFRRAKNKSQERRKQLHQRFVPVIRVCGEVVRSVLDRTIPDAELRASIIERWSEEQLQHLSQECHELGQPIEILYVEELRSRYSYLRQFAPRLLETFTLRGVAAHEPLLEAVEYLKSCNRQERKFCGESAPVDFIPVRWQAQVCPEPGVVDRQLWEICLLEQLRLALRSGNVHVPHSRTFQPVETYLLSREKWDKQRIQISQEHQLPLDFHSYWPKVEALLKENLRTLDESYPHDPNLQIVDDRFHVARLDKFIVPDSAEELKETIQGMIQRRPLTDLLLEVQSWTAFLGAFTKITSGRPVTEAGTAEVLKLLTCLIAEACNINLTDMELVGPGFSRRQLEDVHFNYLREETLAKAAATLVNFHLGQWLTAAWGQGHTSSSDAKVYGVPLRALNATYHPKYFASAGRGVAIYTHISDLWIPFYTQVITCHVRQAPFMLDGLLYHGTRLEPREHYTDSHGYTDGIFGISNLLGIRFAPRIKDLPETRLWRLPDHTHYKHISGVFSGRINVELIRETWDEIIRLIASIKTGEVRASLIAAKIAASSHSSKLFRGVQEFGRVFKTAHIAQYLFDELLRRRVLQGLNKGESMNSLAGDVRFVKKGELRDLTYEDQLNAASSLNLVLAAIVVWNTIHMQACIRKLETDGRQVDKEDLRFLSPTIRKHIGIYGQYRFDADRLELAPPPEALGY